MAEFVGKQWNNRPLTQEEIDEFSARFERIADYLAECLAIVDDLFPEGEDERKPQPKAPANMWMHPGSRGETV